MMLARPEMVLAALAAGGEGATYSPVQVQKLFFLIDRRAPHLVNGPHFAFRPYDYGPFDSAVYDTLDFLGYRGSVQIQGAGKYRLYSLTAGGFAAGQGTLSNLPVPTAEFLRALARWVLSLDFKTLVAAIYEAYPDMKANSIFRE